MLWKNKRYYSNTERRKRKLLQTWFCAAVSCLPDWLSTLPLTTLRPAAEEAARNCI